MTRPLTFLIVATAVSTAAFAVEDSLPKAIKTQYRGVEKAVNTGDLKAFGKFFTADFVSVDPKGETLDRSAFMKGVAELFASYNTGKMKEAFSKVVKKGDTYEVSATFSGVMSGKGGKVTVKEVCTDYWRKDGGVWKMFKTVDTVFDVTPVKKRGQGGE